MNVFVVILRYHKAHLTRRLILDTSADSEMEENMVEWLRVFKFKFCFVLSSEKHLPIKINENTNG